MQKLKYAVLYLLLVIVIASRLKLKDQMDIWGLRFVDDENSSQMNYLGLGFSGFEGSVFLFLLIGLLFLFFVYDFLNSQISAKFFSISGLVFAFALFAFSETMIRILSIALVVLFLLKVFSLKQPRTVS